MSTLLTNGSNPSLLWSEKINASEVARQPPLDSEKPKVHKINKIIIIIIMIIIIIIITIKLSYMLSRLL